MVPLTVNLPLINKSVFKVTVLVEPIINVFNVCDPVLKFKVTVPPDSISIVEPTSPENDPVPLTVPYNVICPKSVVNTDELLNVFATVIAFVFKLAS